MLMVEMFSSLSIKLGILTLSFYGMLNALLSIFFVTPYRQHFYRNFILSWFQPLFKCFGQNIPINRYKIGVLRTNENLERMADNSHQDSMRF